MNNKGFVMPTIFAFIIISSGFILFQSFSLITQIYTLKSEINDLYKLEVVVNSRRIIDSISTTDSCSNTIALSYKNQRDQQYAFTINCIYVLPENNQYMQSVNDIINEKTLNAEQYNALLDIIINSKSEIINDKVIISVNDQVLEGEYSQKLYIAKVDYLDQETNIILIDEQLNIITNTNVKIM